MKKPPKGWPRMTSTLFYDDAAEAIDWLCRAFGFEVRLRVEGEGGCIDHSELVFDDGLVIVNSASRHASRPRPLPYKSPRALGGANTQTITIYVDDVDAHCGRARAAGATILQPPETHDYGAESWTDRGYGAEDPEGHQWWFCQRMRDPAGRAE